MNDGSQVKQCIQGGVSKPETFALTPFISKSVNIHWHMPSLSIPSYKLGKKYMYKKLFSCCLVIEENDASIDTCCFRG